MNAIHHQPASEQITRGIRSPEPGPRHNPPATRVVVGVDGSAGATAALQWAAAEACRRGAALQIVSAREDPGPGEPRAHRPGDPPAAATRIDKALAHVLNLPYRPRHIACFTPSGHPGRVLVDKADGADLLVLGTRGSGTAQAPGRTGRYCLQHAPGALVFVRG